MPEQNWAAAVDRQAILAIASDLIAIPSPSGTEGAVMAFVQSWLDERGVGYDVVAKDPSRPNVIATIAGAAGPLVAMNGHLDTVPVSDPAAWRSDPFAPTVSADGKRLYGRGASDMKSSVAVMMHLMDVFKTASLTGRLQVHVVSDEETGGEFGAVHLIDEINAGRLPKPDYCLIGEKSDLKVRNAERGIVAFVVKILGRASHTATARAGGINAIAKAATAVLALDTEIDKFHPAVGKPVISINTIRAGVAHNVVPGECTFTIDRRLIPGETAAGAEAEIRATLDQIGATDPDFRYELTADPKGDAIPANITPEDSPLVRSLEQSVREVTGAEPAFFVAWAGATDGRYYRQIGVDTVGYGPGGERAHGANEAVYIDDLVTQAKVWADTIGRLLSAS